MADLLSRTGHVLSIDDFDSLAKLNEIAARIEDDTDGEADDLFNMPVIIAGLPFYRLSLGAIHWINEYAQVWFTDGDPVGDLAVAYASHHAQDPSTLRELADKAQATKEIKRFWAGLRCDTDTLKRGLSRVISFREPQDGDEQCLTCGQYKANDEDSPERYGPIVGLLTKEYGNTPEYWLWHASMSLCQELLEDYSTRMEKQFAAEKRSRMVSRGPNASPKTHKAVAPPASPKLAAMKEFRELRNKIESSWKKEPCPNAI